MHSPIHPTILTTALIALVVLTAGTLRADEPAPPTATTSDSLYDEFQSPGPDFRGKPFWSWNGDLDERELLRQIDVLKTMGMGGFFMHSRTGLVTEYLGDEWFELINACADRGQELGMEAWLYDEDRWPSGTAGGAVTIKPEFRMRRLHMEIVPGGEFRWKNNSETNNDQDQPPIFAAFAGYFNGLKLGSYQRITAETPRHEYADDKDLMVFRVREMPCTSFYNGTTYVDTMNREAIDYYIDLTHEQYKKNCGDRLGRSIKGIFTDEPHRGCMMSTFSEGTNDSIPWTGKLPEEFERRFGYDLVERLPELMLQKDGERVSPVKWQFVDLTQQLFLENFMAPCRDWCRENNMIFTGHALHEDSLTAQTAMQGSLMRCYEYMDYPGVDVLTEGNRNYWIVKQLQSAARQCGQKHLMSELYGCTGWQMSFEDYKAVGDWQALFGINLRCHHLSWYTMEGQAKRDYPASMFFQSAWWDEHDRLETYYARLGYMLSQGEPVCDTLVINPIESVWCQIHPGWAKGLAPGAPEIKQLEQGYREIFEWLAGHQIDFDYGDEEMLARLGDTQPGSLWSSISLGKAKYRTVIVPRMTTIRSTTLELLEAFADKGGKVIFVGPAPEYVDAMRSDRAKQLAKRAIQINWDEKQLTETFNKLGRYIIIQDNETDESINNAFAQVRMTDASDHEPAKTIITCMNMDRNNSIKNAKISFICDDNYCSVSEWDCVTGERFAVDAKKHTDTTLLGVPIDYLTWTTDLSPVGTRMFVIEKKTPKLEALPRREKLAEVARTPVDKPMHYQLDEPNVCVLDIAQFAIDDGDLQPANEVLKVDQAVRDHFGLAHRGGQMVQPWFLKKQQAEQGSSKSEKLGTVRLLYDFEIETLPAKPIKLAIERPELLSAVKINGRPTQTSSGPNHDPYAPGSWWVDPIFQTASIMGMFREGKNTIELVMPFEESSNIEAIYLLGDFGVRLDGNQKTIVGLPETLTAGSIVAQGLPFYGGKITYQVPVPQKPQAGNRMMLELPEFEGALVKVSVDGSEPEMIAWQPYSVDVTDEVDASDTLDVEVVLTRRNTFGPLHLNPPKSGAYGPNHFTTGGAAFKLDRYMLWPAGLLQPPMLVEQEPLTE